MNTLIKGQLEYHEPAYQSATWISWTRLSKCNWNILHAKWPPIISVILLKGQPYGIPSHTLSNNRVSIHQYGFEVGTLPQASVPQQETHKHSPVAESAFRRI
jgi:hypothetical protein